MSGYRTAPPMWLVQRLAPSAAGRTLLAVACGLWHHNGPDSIVWPTIETVARAVGMNERVVRRALSALAAMGAIRDTGKRKGRTGRVIVRELACDELFKPDMCKPVSADPVRSDPVPPSAPKGSVEVDKPGPVGPLEATREPTKEASGPPKAAPFTLTADNDDHGAGDCLRAYNAGRVKLDWLPVQMTKTRKSHIDRVRIEHGDGVEGWEHVVAVHVAAIEENPAQGRWFTTAHMAKWWTSYREKPRPRPKGTHSGGDHHVPVPFDEETRGTAESLGAMLEGADFTRSLDTVQGSE